MIKAYPLEEVQEIEKIFEIKIENPFTDKVRVTSGLATGLESILMPPSSIGNFVRGKIALVQDRLEEAGSFFEAAASQAKVEKENPIKVWSYLFLAYIKVIQKKDDEATAYFKNACGGDLNLIPEAIMALIKNKNDCALPIEKQRDFLFRFSADNPIQKEIPIEQRQKFNQERYLLLGEMYRESNPDLSKGCFKQGYIEYGSSECFLKCMPRAVQYSYVFVQNFLLKEEIDRETSVRTLHLSLLEETIAQKNDKIDFESLHKTLLMQLVEQSIIRREEVERIIKRLKDSFPLSSTEKKIFILDIIIQLCHKEALSLEFSEKMIGEILNAKFKSNVNDDRPIVIVHMMDAFRKKILSKDFIRKVIQDFFFQSLASEIFTPEICISIFSILDKVGESIEILNQTDKEQLFTDQEIQEFLKQFIQNPRIEERIRRRIIKRIAQLQKKNQEPEAAIYQTILQSPYKSFRDGLLKELELTIEDNRPLSEQAPDEEYWFPELYALLVVERKKSASKKTIPVVDKEAPEETMTEIYSNYAGKMTPSENKTSIQALMMWFPNENSNDRIEAVKVSCNAVIEKIESLPEKARPKYRRVRALALQWIGELCFLKNEDEEAYQYYSQSTSLKREYLDMAKMIAEGQVKEKSFAKMAIFFLAGVNATKNAVSLDSGEQYKKCFELFSKDPNFSHAFSVLWISLEARNHLRKWGRNFLPYEMAKEGRKDCLDQLVASYTDTDIHLSDGRAYIVERRDHLALAILKLPINEEIEYSFFPLVFNPFDENFVSNYFKLISEKPGESGILLNLLKVSIREKVLPYNVIKGLLARYDDERFDEKTRLKALAYSAEMYHRSKKDLQRNGVLLRVKKLSVYKNLKYQIRFGIFLGEEQEKKGIFDDHKIVKLKEEIRILRNPNDPKIKKLIEKINHETLASQDLEDQARGMIQVDKPSKTRLLYEAIKRMKRLEKLEEVSTDFKQTTHSIIQSYLIALNNELISLKDTGGYFGGSQTNLTVGNTIQKTIQENLDKIKTNDSDGALSKLLKDLIFYIQKKVDRNSKEKIKLKPGSNLHTFLNNVAVELSSMGQLYFGEAFHVGMGQAVRSRGSITSGESTTGNDASCADALYPL
ncbi:MAG: hypothetical protein JSS53_07845 [Proteobacteria bacterium]|nr:hypothetical protein [Pseudomonadota bacterium]